MKTNSLIFYISSALCITQAPAQQQQIYPIFNHVYLSVHNTDSSLGFYTKAFNLTLTDRFTQLNYTYTDTALNAP